MLVNFITWATLLTYAVATSFSYRYSTKTPSLYPHHSVSISAPYNHYSTMTSGISSHYQVSISVPYSHYTIVSSIPYSHHTSATMIGSAITSSIYSSKFKVTYSYIISSTKYSGSMTSESLIRPTGSHTKPFVSYSYIGSPFLSTTVSHSANITKYPAVSSTKVSTAHSRYNTTALVHTTITGTISRSQMRLTGSHTASSISRTYIASPVSSENALHSVSMTVFPTPHSATLVISSTLVPCVNKSIDGSYSHTALPTKSYYVTSCVMPGTRCSSSQFSSPTTTLPISNLIYHSNPMISVSTSSVYMSKVDEGNVDSPTKTQKETPTATFGQPRESSIGADGHIEAASSKFSAPIFLLISDIIILIMALF